VDDFPELEQLILRRHGSLSVALVPIFNGERWWGVIGFTDCAEARSWTKAEIEALRSAAGLISAAVQRSEDKAALAASEERYRTLLANLPGVVYRATPGQPWGTSYISESIVQLSGYPASDFIGRPARSVQSIIHPYDLATIDAQGLTDQPTFEIEYRIRHANGSMRWVCDRGQHAYDSAGQVLYIDGFMVDITQRKQMDEQLRALTTQLEQRVIARTAEISTVNERLRGSITALEHSREALVLSEAHYRTCWRACVIWPSLERR
jgi:PAS domain S-box-containing protein